MATLPLPRISRRERTLDDEKRMELTEHLAELRTHIIRSIWYLILGAIIAYQFFPSLYMFLYRPLEREMLRQNVARARAEGARLGIEKVAYATSDPVSKAEFNALVDAYNRLIERPAIAPYMSLTFTKFYEPFMMRLTVSIIAGFVLVSPLVLREFALFILPALTPQERRPLKLLIPASAVLLCMGVTVAYCTMFFAMSWFLSYLGDFPAGANLMQNPHDYVIFMVKAMAVFGVAFQMPVVLMGLAFVGLVTSKGLLKHWRWGVVASSAGGLFIPTNDLVSMFLLSGSLLVLYFLSVFLVRLVERLRAKQRPTVGPSP
jgi:sec-independent protein translocase protein TatC